MESYQDDSQEGAFQTESSSGESNVSDRTVEEKNLQLLENRRVNTTSFFVGSFVEQMCLLFAKNNNEGKTLFLEVIKKLSPIIKFEKEVYSDSLSKVRAQYREVFLKLIKKTYEELYGSALTFNQDQLAVEKIDGRSVTTKYNTDFVEMNNISSGAYGSVFRCKNVFDECIYAVKKIAVSLKYKNCDQRLKKIKKEVDFLSHLNHPNVIRYFSSWVEHPCLVSDVPSETGSFNSSARIRTLSESLSNDFRRQLSFKQLEDDNYSFEFCDEEGKAGGDGGWTEAECNSLNEEDSQYEDSFEEEEEEAVDYSSGENIVMYIQMQLCETTLYDMMIARNKNKNADAQKVYRQNISIFKQLLHALSYIHHDKQWIHRDVSTRNIFLDGSSVLLGDFGLSSYQRSAPNVHKGTEVVPVGQNGDKLTTGIGTPLYSAPEMYSKDDYTSAVDMYSAGVVLLELFHFMGTFMEKQETIQCVRKQGLQGLPEDLLSSHPKVCELIVQLLSEDPAERPTARQLLTSNELFSGETNFHQEEVDQLRAENEQLRRRVEALEKDILKLTQKNAES